MNNRDAGLAIVCIGVAAAVLGYLVDIEYVLRMGALIAVVGLGVTALGLIRQTKSDD